ncbi:DNA mismatch repair endonuclease MutL [Halobellus sp. Atlit-31R]|nr:DNA mismatch repair endonuclease MutL [Halobellus sp. Atlit-31R]
MTDSGTGETEAADETDATPTIRALDERTVRQIAAGEVVERPASVVKELLENGLDAGADRISVAVDAGGTEGVRVRDDGVGMDRESVQRAVEEHTTSKIEDIGDLEAGVGTLGFRGEALHTIGAVSRLTIRTKPRGGDGVGTELRVEGGEVTEVSAAGCPEGTVVEVADLFYNTPARRKFLKTTATEFDHVNTVVTHYALANPDVAISLEHDDREVFATEGRGSRRSTVLSVYGREVAEAMIEVAHEPAAGPIERVTGLVSHPETTRSTREYLSTFVNDRYVTARVLRESVLDAYGGQLAADRYPFAVLFVDVPADAVDVNVHPRKMEVRFDDEAGVREAVTDAVRGALLDAGLIRSSAPRGRSAPDEAAIEPESPATEVRGGAGHGSPPSERETAGEGALEGGHGGALEDGQEEAAGASRDEVAETGETSATPDTDARLDADRFSDSPTNAASGADNRASTGDGDGGGADGVGPDEGDDADGDDDTDGGRDVDEGDHIAETDDSDRSTYTAESGRARTVDPTDDDAWTVTASGRDRERDRNRRGAGGGPDRTPADESTSGGSPSDPPTNSSRTAVADTDAEPDTATHAGGDTDAESTPSDAGRPSERTGESRPTGIVGPTVQRDLRGETATLEPDFDSLPSMRILGQLHDTYVVAETDSGMVLIDQHAADERVNYERLRRELDGDVATQALAEPVELELTAREAALFESYREALVSLGFRAERVDDRTVEVETVPAVFAAALDPELLRDALAAFVAEEGGAETVEAVADDLLADLACYPSVTGNTSLTEGSVVALLDALDDCENPYACPHGRPVVVAIDGDEIADRFERDYPGHGGRRDA